MNLLPQDVLIAIRLALIDGTQLTYEKLGLSVGLNPSQAHQSVKRATHAGLLLPHTRAPKREALFEFLVHGLKYVLAPKRGPLTRGYPTAHAAPPLTGEILADEPYPVWPHPEGVVRGEAFEPIYKTVPVITRNDSKLYECLALVDAIRGGRARERKIAATMLEQRLSR